MTKNTIVNEYVKSLSEEDLRFLHMRMTLLCDGDYQDIFKKFEENFKLNSWLMTASSHAEFYEMIELVFQAVASETAARKPEKKEKKVKKLQPQPSMA